jgi:hypothetical protein
MKKLKKINYQSKKFIKGLNKIKKMCKLSSDQSKIDRDNMYIKFDI